MSAAGAVGAEAGGCTVCGGPLRGVLAGLAFLARDRYLECRACGLWQSHPDPAREAQFYAEVYPSLRHKQDEPAGRLPLFAETLDEIERLAPGRRLLDVGCGAGHFLELARARGFAASGIELSPALAHQAATRSGCPVATGTIENLEPSPPFDVVTLWNVLDQVPEPLSLLVQAGRRLGPQGLLFVRVPNGTFHRPLMRLIARLGPASNRGGLASLTPLHPFVLRPRDLHALLLRAQFTGIELRPSRPTRGPAPLVVRQAKLLAGTIATALATLSARKLLLSPSIEAFARAGAGAGE